MLEARSERIRRSNEAAERRAEAGPERRVTPEQLFAQMGIDPKKGRSN